MRPDGFHFDFSGPEKSRREEKEALWPMGDTPRAAEEVNRRGPQAMSAQRQDSLADRAGNAVCGAMPCRRKRVDASEFLNSRAAFTGIYVLKKTAIKNTDDAYLHNLFVALSSF